MQRWLAFARRVVVEHLGPLGQVLLAAEVAALLGSVTKTLDHASALDFFPTWQALATQREAFRRDTRLGIAGPETAVTGAQVLRFLAAVDLTLTRGLARAHDAQGLPVSYYTHEVVEFERLLAPAPALASTPAPAAAHRAHPEPAVQHVQAKRFMRQPIAAFLEGAVHALRSSQDPAQARRLRLAVRQSALYDTQLGMYRVNVPLDDESFEIGRSRIFAPGWLENESIFLHMHYKFLLETLRSGLAEEFFEDLKRGLVAFFKPEVYGRSPLENSSFIASSRFPDTRAHGVGFIARLSGATAEWISMVLHMGLGATPFRVEAGSLRFEPKPVLADWLFTRQPTAGFGPNSFGFKLFGQTWVVYDNPQRGATFGPQAVVPVSFELRYADGRQTSHCGASLPTEQALALREGQLSSLLIRLDQAKGCAR